MAENRFHKMKLYTETGGDGPDLVLIHGWGLHAGVWDEFAPLLEAGFRVTRIDLPGHGRSDWQGDGSLDEMVDALLAATPETAVWLGWWMNRVRHQEQVISAVEHLGGRLTYSQVASAPTAEVENRG